MERKRIGHNWHWPIAVTMSEAELDLLDSLARMSGRNRSAEVRELIRLAVQQRAGGNE